MTKLEQHRKIWQGKSDEWLFERLANELTQKVEEIHKLLAENEQLRLYNVSQQRELLNALADNFNESTHTYIGQSMIEETLKAFNCG